MNDIWSLPTGEWVVYSDESRVIRDFMSLADLDVFTSYHGIIKRHRAMQFKFPNTGDLLEYVCFLSGFDYDRVIKLRKRPGYRYSDMFSGIVFQPPLFTEASPRRKRKGR